VAVEHGKIEIDLVDQGYIFSQVFKVKMPTIAVEATKKVQGLLGKT
jgi:hypothetical protein